MASITACTMLLDFVVELGACMLLSRRAVDVGVGGVG
jgi:hypothetical protein